METARHAWTGLALIAALAGCGDPGAAPDPGALPTASERGTFALEITHDDGAFHRGSNSFGVRATDAAGRAASLAGVTARMPGHDHAPTPPRIDCGDGRCRVSDLVLAMPGRWEITLRLRLPGAQDDARLSPELR